MIASFYRPRVAEILSLKARAIVHPNSAIANEQTSLGAGSCEGTFY
jgi:hypothetical protein